MKEEKRLKNAALEQKLDAALTLIESHVRTLASTPAIPAVEAATAPIRKKRSMASGRLVAAGERKPRAREKAKPTRFEIAKPLPGVLPTDKAKDFGLAKDEKLAIDDAYQSMYGSGGEVYGQFDGLAFFGFPILATLNQRSEYRQLHEVIAEEMTRKWIRLTSPNDGQGPNGKKGKSKAKKLARLDELLKEHGIRDKFKRLTHLDSEFGRAHLFIDLNDGETSDDEFKTMLLYEPEKINQTSAKKLVFKVMEPTWTYPGPYNASNPLKKHYYDPQTWYVMGKEVHKTRLLTMVTRPMPDILKPAYSFAGMSMTQMAKPYIDNWLRTRQSVSDLIHSFAINILMTNMETVLTDEDDDGEGLISRLELFNANRDNMGVFAIDKLNEDLKQVATPLGTLDKLQAQAQEQIAAVGRLPLVKYLGVTPSGLNASSDGEIRVLYDHIGAKQANDYTELLRVVIWCLQLAEWGTIDKDIDFTFEPLWQLDEVAKAGVRKTNADTAAVYMQEGVIDAEEERRRIAAEEGTIYSEIDPNVLPDPPQENKPIDGSEPDAAASGNSQDMPGEQKSGGSDTSNDAAPRTLYMRRPLANVEALEAWADQYGLKLDEDLHVTIAYSQVPFAWSEAQAEHHALFVEELDAPWSITELGDKLVLEFGSTELNDRHHEIVAQGAVWSFPTYRSHISLCDKADAPMSIEPYTGVLEFDGEIWTQIAESKRTMFRSFRKVEEMA